MTGSNVLRNFCLALLALACTAAHAQFTEATWTTHTSMPAARGQAATAVDNLGRIYVIGGYVSNTEVNTNYRFTPGTPGTWATLAPMPVAARGASAVYKAGKVYVFGGFPTQQLQTYDVATDSWTLVSVLGMGWENAAAMEVGGRIFVTGGETGAFGNLEFTPPSTFVARASMPTEHMEHGAAAVGGLIYVFGGVFSNYTAHAVVESYDPVANAWSGAPLDLPSPRTQFAYASAGQFIYVLGGSTSGGNYDAPFFDTTLMYNTVANTWTAGPNLPAASREGTAAVVGSRLYVFGGGTSSSASSAVYSIGVVPDAAPVSAPTVTTTAATGVGVTTATLNGTVNPNGSATNASFQYSLSPTLASGGDDDGGAGNRLGDERGKCAAVGDGVERAHDVLFPRGGCKCGRDDKRGNPELYDGQHSADGDEPDGVWDNRGHADGDRAFPAHG